MSIPEYPIDNLVRLKWLLAEFNETRSRMKKAVDIDQLITVALTARLYQLVVEILELMTKFASDRGRSVERMLESLEELVNFRDESAEFARGSCDPLRSLHRLFVATNNPIYALCGWLLSRARGPVPPKWVSEYFDAAIPKFLDSCIRSKAGETGLRVNHEFAEAFGVARPAGPTIWTQFTGIEPPWFETGAAIASRLAEVGTSTLESWMVDEVAKEHEVSGSTVRRDWSHFERMFPEAADPKSWRELAAALLAEAGPVE